MKIKHLIISGFVLFLSGCAFYDTSIKGQIVELVNPNTTEFADRYKPVPDALVLASWNGYHFSFPEPGQVCINNRLVKADSKGSFIVPSWIKFPKLYPVFGINKGLRVYKKGYINYAYTAAGLRQYYKDPPGLIVLVKDDSDHNRRLGYLGHLTWVGSCKTDYVWEYDSTFDEWYKALYEEALSLQAPTTTGGEMGLSSVRDMVIKRNK